MTKETLEVIRERLIRDERVRQMIRVRAYEIYQMRGPHPGGQAQDWFQAEEEVLAFLIADESQQGEEKEARQPVNTTPARVPQSEPGKKTKPARTSDTKKATSKATTTKRATSKRPTGSKPKRIRKQPKPGTPD